MNTDEIHNVESAESERLLSGNTVQAHIYGSKDPVCLLFIVYIQIAKCFLIYFSREFIYSFVWICQANYLLSCICLCQTKNFALQLICLYMDRIVRQFSQHRLLRFCFSWETFTSISAFELSIFSSWSELFKQFRPTVFVGDRI